MNDFANLVAMIGADLPNSWKKSCQGIFIRELNRTPEDLGLNWSRPRHPASEQNLTEAWNLKESWDFLAQNVDLTENTYFLLKFYADNVTMSFLELASRDRRTLGLSQRYGCGSLWLSGTPLAFFQALKSSLVFYQISVIWTVKAYLMVIII